MTPEEFVRELAEESPIYPADSFNVCKYCHVTWAEENYDVWYANEIAAAREGRYVSGHHEIDCVWVRANQIVRSV